MKESTDYIFRKRRLKLPIWLFVFIQFCGAWYCYETGSEQFRPWLLSFIFAYLGALLLELNSHLNYRCPKCGRRLRKPTVDYINREYIHECPDCCSRWRSPR